MKPGEQHLRRAVRQIAPRPPRRQEPQPYDEDWGWWIQERLKRIETQMKWLLGLALSALAGEVIRIFQVWVP
jgi:hypothetical protein